MLWLLWVHSCHAWELLQKDKMQLVGHVVGFLVEPWCLTWSNCFPFESHALHWTHWTSQTSWLHYHQHAATLRTLFFSEWSVLIAAGTELANLKKENIITSNTSCKHDAKTEKHIRKFSCLPNLRHNLSILQYSKYAHKQICFCTVSILLSEYNIGKFCRSISTFQDFLKVTIFEHCQNQNKV
jgi:hypothetical protein